jgi:hypothetical protein
MRVVSDEPTEPGYYVSIALRYRDERGDWWHDRGVGGPVATAAEVPELLRDGLLRFADDLEPNEPPRWHMFVIEQDGSKRDATEVEKSAVVAWFEQRALGFTVSLDQPDAD